MPGWRDEFLASIKAVEINNPVNRDLVDTCTQLQDRVAALEAEKNALLQSTAPQGREIVSTKQPQGPTSLGKGPASPDPTVAKLRLDLAESLRAQGQQQARLKVAEDELERLRAKTANDTKTLRLLTAERNALATKVRDRDEELRGKSKLVEEVQDELLALTLQLNVLEQQKAKVQAENKELVDRWMKRKGQEADALNLANEPLFTKRS